MSTSLITSVLIISAADGWDLVWSITTELIWGDGFESPAASFTLPSNADLIDFPFNTSWHALLNCFNLLVASPGYPSCINSMAMSKWLAISPAYSSSILSNSSDSLISASSPSFLVIVAPTCNKALRPLANLSFTNCAVNSS